MIGLAWCLWQSCLLNASFTSVDGVSEDAERGLGIIQPHAPHPHAANSDSDVGTPTMTIKNAALLALVGTILATVLLVWTFVSTALNVLRGVAPAVMLFPWFVYAFACFSVAVFFYVFHRAQS
jgi:sterol desaturase/sphingolipid hydroxylase (fatty acid hydroxylase superfamily)